MKLKFVNAKRVNPSRDGLDIVYYYTIDEDQDTHKFHAVATKGGASGWFMMSDNDVYDYSKRIFAPVLDFIKNYWADNKELPKEDKEYYESLHYNLVGESEIDWHNFELEL